VVQHLRLAGEESIEHSGVNILLTSSVGLVEDLVNMKQRQQLSIAWRIMFSTNKQDESEPID